MTDMSTADTLIGFVLDESGSMYVVRTPTMEGFNAFMKGQREAPGEALLSLTLFNTEFHTRYVATPLHRVPPMGDPRNQYTPRGGTALLDAVGATVKGIESWELRHGFGGTVKIVVLTDGEENRSEHWHINDPRDPADDHDLLNLIEYKQKEGWEFVFLGAGGSAWLERKFASVVGREAIFAYANTSTDTVATYANLNNAMVQTRASGPGGQSLSSSMAEQETSTSPSTGSK